MKRVVPSICDVVGCGSPAVKMPELQYWALGFARDTHPPISIALSLAVCASCASKAHDRELLHGHYALACTSALGLKRALPDKTTARVRWWAIGDPKAPHADVWAKT
jgi:hypothetical protein